MYELRIGTAKREKKKCEGENWLKIWERVKVFFRNWIMRKRKFEASRREVCTRKGIDCEELSVQQSETILWSFTHCKRGRKRCNYTQVWNDCSVFPKGDQKITLEEDEKFLSKLSSTVRLLLCSSKLAAAVLRPGA